MKKWISLALLIAGTVGAKAQYASLSGAELKKLKGLIEKDTVVASAFNPFRKMAEQSLTEQPNPIQKITSQGLLEGNPAKTASLKAVRDADKVYALALVYRLYGDKAYLNKVSELLQAWAKTNQASGGPIDETKLESMITGYDLIRAKLDSETRLIVDEWMDRIATAEVNSSSARPGRGTAINNWNSHRIKVIALIAYTLHSSKYYETVVNELTKQIGQNLNADGTSIDFVERDAFHYHTYDLEPLLTAVITIKRATGKSYFDYESDKQASIKKSVDFMAPYMTGQKQHGEFVNSTVAFDKARAANHEKGYEAGTPFNPQSGVYTFALASYFDKDYLKVIKKVTNNPHDYIKWQLVLNQVRK